MIPSKKKKASRRKKIESYISVGWLTYREAGLQGITECLFPSPQVEGQGTKGTPLSRFNKGLLKHPHGLMF